MSVEQETVDHGFVLICDVGDRAGQGEDEVEVTDRQEFGFALGEPLPGRHALALRAQGDRGRLRQEL